MDKVYVVMEEYTEDCATSTSIQVFDTLGKAKSLFDKIIEREKQYSWIKDFMNDYDYTSEDGIIHQEEYYFCVRDFNRGICTKISISEQEVK